MNIIKYKGMKELLTTSMLTLFYVALTGFVTVGICLFGKLLINKR